MFIPQNLPLPLVFARAAAAGASATALTVSASAISPAVKLRLTEAVEEAKRTGAISQLDVKLHRAWVAPLVWRIWRPEAKEGFVMSVAIYCAQETASESYYAEVIDGRSRRMLAHYGRLGAKVF